MNKIAVFRKRFEFARLNSGVFSAGSLRDCRWSGSCLPFAEKDKTVCDIVRHGLPFDFDELPGYFGETAVSGKRPVDDGQVDPVGNGQRLPVDLAATADEDLVSLSCQRQGRCKIVGDTAALGAGNPSAG